RSKNKLSLNAELGKVEIGDGMVKLTVTPEKNRWVPFTLTLNSEGGAISIEPWWVTKEDDRKRPLPLHRMLLPWAQLPRETVGTIVRDVPEIKGGDWEEGKRVFFGEKANCAKCHKMRGEGAAIGPDLSNLVFRDYQSVIKDIREPSAAINPDYLAYVVELN